MANKKKEKLNDTSYGLESLNDVIEEKNTKIKKSKESKKKMNKDRKVKEQPKEKITKKRRSYRNKRIRRRRRNNNKRIILIFIILIIIGIFIIIGYKIVKDKELKQQQNELKEAIMSHYNEYVITNKETDIYKLNNSKYEKVGKIGNKQELTLDNMEITHEIEYFKISTFEEEYYIYYKDVESIEKITSPSDRYKKYIAFNKNIITKDITNFYDEKGNLVYKLPSSHNLPIIVNKKDIYGVEFNNKLLYVKKDDVSKVKNNQNTKEKVSTKIRTLAYHRIYDPKTEECDQVICHTEEQFNSHMEYLSKNNYLTLTMQELSDFIDGYIQIPVKSTVITIDDGTLVKRGITILEKYKLNATLFVITSRFKESDYNDKFKSDYVELHSHSHNMHWAGECAGYGTQGGGILCLPESRVLEDLKTSSEILNGSTVFCYPFYDYSTRAINLLKEAGYTMAFAGLLNTNGLAYVGTNKMLIPRATILSYTTFSQFKAYVTY